MDHRESKGIPEDYFCFIDYLKFFDCMDHIILWKILKEMGIPNHLTCLLRNLYAGQEATVRTGCGTPHWFQIGKGVCPVVMYGCESWTINKAEHQRIDAFELWCWRRLLRVPWTARGSNQSILKKTSPEYSTEVEIPILWPPDVKN